jgi:rhodanese-related sulfurtransferase
MQAKLALGLGTLCAVALSAEIALAKDALPEKKQTELGLYLTAKEAAELRATDAEAVLIDIRSRAEVAFVGIGEGIDKHIPYMVMDQGWQFDAEKGTYRLVRNPDFLDAFEAFAWDRGLEDDATIILMCRSGSRSARAANLLHQMGYERVYSVIDGFEGDRGPTGTRDVNGWKNSDLAWSYRIPAEIAYRSQPD